MKALKDYNGKPLTVGDRIRNIESGWKGEIVEFDETYVPQGHGVLLKCKGVNFWTNTLDDDDTQWHSPDDVVKSTRQPARPGEPINPINFM